MKKIFLCLTLFVFGIVGTANALTFSFSDKDFPYVWGQMDIEVFDSDTLQIKYEASSTIPAGSQVTGFGFAFDSNPSPIWNPSTGAYTDDNDSLNWISYTKAMGTLPGIANGDEFTPAITQADYLFAATEGNANNFNPPGILPGTNDVFYLDFSVDFLASGFAIEDFVNLTGIRLQSLPDNINGGSLFLAGHTPATPAPEPATILLLGTGLVGLGGFRRKFKK